MEDGPGDGNIAKAENGKLLEVDDWMVAAVVITDCKEVAEAGQIPLHFVLCLS